jgi:xanthine/uracil permease
MKNKSNLNAFQKMVVGVQFLFVAFGVMVLMPLLVGVVLNMILPRCKA